MNERQYGIASGKEEGSREGNLNLKKKERGGGNGLSLTLKK